MSPDPDDPRGASEFPQAEMLVRLCKPQAKTFGVPVSAVLRCSDGSVYDQT